jgi:aspartyl/asparaginyl-tRNA synthetase
MVDYYFADTTEKGKIAFGDYSLIASQHEDKVKTITDIKQIGKEGGPAFGDLVHIRGRVSSVRAKGNACFMVLRSTFYTVQACHFKDKENPDDSKSLIKFVGNMPLESIVDIVGVLVEAKVNSCSQDNAEIQILKCYTVSRAPVVLPFLLEDAARSQKVRCCCVMCCVLSYVLCVCFCWRIQRDRRWCSSVCVVC